MLRLNNQIRLTSDNVRRLKKLTLLEPQDIRTLEDLDQFIERAKARFNVPSQKRDIIFELIEEELVMMLGA